MFFVVVFFFFLAIAGIWGSAHARVEVALWDLGLFFLLEWCFVSFLFLFFSCYAMRSAIIVPIGDRGAERGDENVQESGNNVS